MMIKTIGVEWVEYIAEHQEMYPAGMREEVETFQRLLKSGFCWGWVDGGELRGWVLCESDLGYIRQVYCYDLAVLLAYQGRGIGRRLWKHACLELRFLGYTIRLHARRQSYRIIIQYHPGYRIEQDRFIEDHYAEEYEDDSLKGEHAHEILLV